MTTESTLERLNRLVGTWTLHLTHPAFPGAVVHGTAEISWLEGGRFLIQRARTDHPDFPDSISVVGVMGRDRVDPENPGSEEGSDSRLCMHYYDSRGVFRVYEASIDHAVWHLWRNAPGFSQRFSGELAEDGETIEGRWELCQDDVSWTSDLEITYRRRPVA
jgi:hypothetical protein